MTRFFEAFSWMSVTTGVVVISAVCMGWILLHIYETSKAIDEAKEATNESSVQGANIIQPPKGSHRHREASEIIAIKYRLLVRKIREFSCGLQRRFHSMVPRSGWSTANSEHEFRFHISQCTPCEPDQQALLDYIGRLRYIGFRCQVLPLQGQMPLGYICIEELWCAGKLVSRMYLKIQVEYVEERTIVSHPTPESETLSAFGTLLKSVSSMLKQI